MKLAQRPGLRSTAAGTASLPSVSPLLLQALHLAQTLTNVGYKLSVIEFANGEPVEPRTSKTAAIDILSNEDVASCADENCFRPVGLAWDSEGRLFMSSDTTGEIYVVMRADGSATSSAGSNATGTVPQGASGIASSTGSSSNSESASATGVASATSMSALAVIFGILAYFV